jgi:hypothetical protein
VAYRLALSGLGAWVFRTSLVALLGSAAILSGCAAADVTPVRMSQPGDQDLSCQALKQQIAENTAAAQKFLKRDHQVEEANTAKQVGGAIPIAGLLLVASTDLSNKEQVEARALADRDEHLQYLAKQKNCTD